MISGAAADGGLVRVAAMKGRRWRRSVLRGILVKRCRFRSGGDGSGVVENRRASMFVLRREGRRRNWRELLLCREGNEMRSLKGSFIW